MSHRKNTNGSDKVKYEVAEALHIPLHKGDNGDITAKDAGKIGGKIGGPMVKELIKQAEQQLKKSKLPD